MDVLSLHGSEFHWLPHNRLPVANEFERALHSALLDVSGCFQKRNKLKNTASVRTGATRQNGPCNALRMAETLYREKVW